MRRYSTKMVLVWGSLWLAGCGARAYEGGDSNSNWLKACESGVECGSGLECLCGVCTVECDGDDVCARGAVASCDAPASCGGAPAVCLPLSKGDDADSSSPVLSSEPSDLPAPEPNVDTTDGGATPIVDITPVTPSGVPTATTPSTDAPNTEVTNPALADPACGADACQLGSQCVETTGRNCVCPTAPLAECIGLTFRTLPLPDGLESCNVAAVSGDGSVIVGDCQVLDGPNRAVRWTSDGPVLVASELDTLTLARGVTDAGDTGFWLGRNGGTYAVTRDGHSRQLSTEVIDGFSADGSVGVGRVPDGLGQSDAFRWTQAGGIELLPTERGNGQALAVSADGVVPVGSVTNDQGINVPVWWVTGGEIELGVPEGTGSIETFSVNADGGYIAASSEDMAFRWRDQENVEILVEMEAASRVRVGAITRDGKRVFGTSAFGGWYWDETTGSRSLEAELGLPDLWTITWIGDVSADGKTIVGSVQLAGDVSPTRWLPFVATLP